MKKLITTTSGTLSTIDRKVKYLRPVVFKNNQIIHYDIIPFAWQELEYGAVLDEIMYINDKEGLDPDCWVDVLDGDGWILQEIACSQGGVYCLINPRQMKSA